MNSVFILFHLRCFQRDAGQLRPGYDFDHMPDLPNIIDANVCVEPMIEGSLCDFQADELEVMMEELKDALKEHLPSKDRKTLEDAQTIVRNMIEYFTFNLDSTYYHFECTICPKYQQSSRLGEW